MHICYISVKLFLCKTESSRNPRKLQSSKKRRPTVIVHGIRYIQKFTFTTYGYHEPSSSQQVNLTMRLLSALIADYIMQSLYHMYMYDSLQLKLTYKILSHIMVFTILSFSIFRQQALFHLLTAYSMYNQVCHLPANIDHCMYQLITACTSWSLHVPANIDHCMYQLITACTSWSMHVPADHCMYQLINACTSWSPTQIICWKYLLMYATTQLHAAECINKIHFSEYLQDLILTV